MNTIELCLENLKEKYTIDFVAKQAAGSVWYQSGGCVILASVCVDTKPVEEDFLPLTVQYIEKSYAIGKFPGGFIKREGKPGEFETLTSRLIDRSLRPLFPKGYTYPTQITIMVLSYDKQADLQVCALNAAANALYLSSLPVYHPVAGLRIGQIEGKFIINPTPEELTQSSLDLYVSGSEGALLMIEMRALNTHQQPNEIPEEELLQALELAQKTITSSCKQYKQAFGAHIKAPLTLPLNTLQKDPQIQAYIKANYAQAIAAAIAQMAKSERSSGLKTIAQEIYQATSIEQGWTLKDISLALEDYKKQSIREQILTQKVRSDGRGYEDIRNIDIQTNILPYAHGSALFTRGQTQALVVSTLGADGDAQIQESLSEKSTNKESFMFHYNFPGFSVGEASIISPPNRRELGHGNLAKRALESSILDRSKTIRLVSEILESNGSSSMASVCGGSLALCASGIEVSGLIAGVAMGLVVDKERYAILSDINGLEDHDGDMDFKVAGSMQGITAMQMDIKLEGVAFEILKQALYQAQKARNTILAIMQKARESIIINTEILPSLEVFSIPPAKVVEVIGQGGKTIKEIIERFKVSIDLNRENGEVKISGESQKNTEGAKGFILDLIESQRVDVSKYEVGEVFVGVVKKVLDFGAFIGLPRGGDGLLHINRFGKGRDYHLKEDMHEGDQVRCQILGYNKGKVELDLVRS
ncbi:polyribonucleotide nucleotidyltransferase [Helicobacter sp. 12S02634-8]|uniref:polyribonucleotide nucleotidyltransferase n=1 Tax=Helicobacter sp. 12S02634-8 TaxID=1476199 RepID=UPI000BA57B31|nr:polyribonucleotide nucleotidyltransferase [Helicobacter sp. 12S02634-8]PAF48577.1 polyribonucleotide nucleotidyltransferase [Helicobacter sp. 12S02634-8]